MRKSRKKPEVFLIDNHLPEKYEFEALEKYIVNKLKRSKGEALVMSITNLTKQTLGQKISELKSQIWRTTLRAALLGTFPAVGKISDEWVIKYMAEYYKDQLGLDVASLNKMSSIAIKVKIDEVMSDIPNLARGHALDTSYSSLFSGVRGLASTAVPVLNTATSAKHVSSSLHCILDRFAAIAVEAIDDRRVQQQADK